MTAPAFLQVDDYYSMLVFDLVHVPGAKFPLTMSDTFQITDKIPATVNNRWRTDLGDMLWDQIERSGLIAIVRQPNAAIKDFNNNSQLRELTAFMRGILLQGIPWSDGQHFLSGAVQADGPLIQHHTELIKFNHNRDLPRVYVSEGSLREAYALSRNIMGHLQDWRRIARGFHYLMDAFSTHYLEDRLHLLVRALDGIVKTGPGQGRVEFSKRCSSTFMKPHPDNYTAMEDLYFVRNAIEHVHDHQEEPQRVKDSAQRKKLTERRLRQLEVLALRVYKRLISDSLLLTEFGKDTAIDAFWGQPDSARFARWNDPVDLDAID